MNTNTDLSVRRKQRRGVESTDEVVHHRKVNTDPLTTEPSVWADFSDSKVLRTKSKPKATTNAALLARRQAAIGRGVGSATNVWVDRAENASLWDVEGKRYIDFGSGIGVLITGQRNPRIMERVMEQMNRFTHVCFQVTPYEGYLEVGERLNERVPVEGPAKTFLFTTGAEAVENAVKIARYGTGRSGVIAFQDAFHGRTNLTLGLTGKVVPYKKGFGPFPGEIYHAPFPNPYRGITEEQSIKALEQFFKADVDPQRIAAIIIEPEQGEGGFNVAPASFLKKLRELCDKHGIMMIADEVQSGFGRTGKLFAIEHSGVKPDLITMAKGLAGGFPLSAVSGRADLIDAAEAGGYGGTYAGWPPACAAALGVIETIDEQRLLQRATAFGDKMRARFEQIKESVPLIGNVRGLGAMVALELTDPKTGAPATAQTKAVVAKALEEGLILLSCGQDGNVLRILVPLTATDDILDKGLDILERALRSVG